MSISNGRVFQSKAASYTVLHPSSKRPTRYNSIGDPVELSTDLTAEFAFHGGDLMFHNPDTGGVERFADIRGHFFDSAQQAEEKGWTQEEHDIVVEHLLAQCRRFPEEVWEVTPARAPLPWPTYADAQPGKLAVLADQLGLAAEALAYERQNKNRGQVVADLEAIVQTAEKAQEPDETPAEIVAA